MNKAVIIGIIVAAVVVAGGAFALMKNSDKETPVTTDTSSQTQQSNDASSGTQSSNNDTSNPSSTDQNSATTITYSNNGFSPATLTVKTGTTITIKNTSSNSLQFQSDPHPQHTDNTELNVGNVAKGGSQTFTVTKTGTWGYHNHLNSSDTGSIVVQ